MVIDELSVDGYERVVHARDDASGLDAYVAIHSLALGPALGGLRVWQYESTRAAQTDAERLARGMTYKNSLAGLDLGGGKAVINGVKTPDKLRAFAEVLNYLDGDYITAEDVGTNPDDMRILLEGSKHVVPPELGDPSPATALGVLRAIEGALMWTYEAEANVPDIGNYSYAIMGVGNVGWAIAEMLAFKGAHLVVADINKDAVTRLVEKIPGTRVMDAAEIHKAPVDVFVPCALGGILNPDTIPEIEAHLVVGSANNQLADEQRDSRLLMEHDIHYVPDYLANAGGVINVYREFEVVPSDYHVAAILDNIRENAWAVLENSSYGGDNTPLNEANKMAEQRLVKATQ